MSKSKKIRHSTNNKSDDSDYQFGADESEDEEDKLFEVLFIIKIRSINKLNSSL